MSLSEVRIENALVDLIVFFSMLTSYYVISRFTSEMILFLTRSAFNPWLRPLYCLKAQNLFLLQFGFGCVRLAYSEGVELKIIHNLTNYLVSLCASMCVGTFIPITKSYNYRTVH